MHAHSLWDAVGQTPLFRVRSLSELTGCEIYGKAEFMNPGGSIKDRAAKGILRSAEARGDLRPGATLIEGTAGNTGIGLAMLGAERGYRVVVTIPNNQAREKLELLAAHGAQVITVPPTKFADPNHFYHRARALAEEHGWYWTNQFENLACGDIHEETTGPELLAASGGLDYFVCAAGTGGSISGISRHLRDRSPSTQIVLADCAGSGLYHHVKHGELRAEGSSISEGIGIMRITANFARAHIDDAMQVSDQAMLDMLLHVAKHDGLCVGTSAALNLWAAYQLGLRHRGQGKRIATLLCDHGSRYASKVFDPAFLEKQGLKSDRALPA